MKRASTWARLQKWWKSQPGQKAKCWMGFHKLRDSRSMPGQVCRCCGHRTWSGF